MKYRTKRTPAMPAAMLWVAAATAIFVIVLAVACTRGGDGSAETGRAPAADPAHNAANSLDWEGTYNGILPCADCPGIETSLTLNMDGTYHLRTRYQDQENGEFHYRGAISWNEAGNTIRLEGYADGPGLYFVAENRLFHLDMDGNRITGDLANHYILEKEMPQAARPLRGTRWVLSEIHGQPVVQRGEDERAPWFILGADSDRIHGFGGCNTFNGTYKLEEGDRIGFSQMASTKMACPGLEVDYESMVFEVLEMADNYSLRDDMLLLNQGQMAPLAVWRAEL
jgi:copper homeostasis protein (lipoprotein)